MYFTFGWPRILRVPEGDPPTPVSQVLANRDKIIFAILTHSSLSIWTSRPCLPVVCHERSSTSVDKLGPNVALIWKPDSTAIVVVTSGGYLLFYGLSSGNKNLYEQVDPDNHKLRRESDELFLKEPIPAITLELVQEIAVRGKSVGCVALFRDELMVSTDENHILRYRWDGTVNNDFCIDLRRIPFSIDQQASRAVPITESNVYPVNLHYSPLVGGFSIVLSDGRAAFLTASTKAYDPNSVQGIWASNIDDATCSSVNHKYRLLSFGRKNAETSVFSVDDQTGGLQLLFHLKLSSKDFPGSPGAVKCMTWTPDGCAIAISWERGGFALWSVFGSLLTCSWSWTGDLSPFAQKIIRSLDWAAEGYQLWMAVEENAMNTANTYIPSKTGELPSAATRSERSNSLPDICISAGLFAVIPFVKSSLTVNPSMSQIEHLYLQGEDRLLINFSGESLLSSNGRGGGGTSSGAAAGLVSGSSSSSKSKPNDSIAPLGNNKNWVVVPIPHTYSATNWPIRYTAMDPEGLNVAVSGRYGLALYSIAERKWKLFGNEAQERDFVVVGGMMWWRNYLVVAVYDIAQDRDELRFYPRDAKLDNKFAHVKQLPSQILLLSLDRDKLLVFAADSTLAIFQLRNDLINDSVNPSSVDPCDCMQTIDISALCVHPACVISIYLTTLKTSFSSPPSSQQHSVVINVSGRLMILHHEFLVQENTLGSNAPQYITPTVLASCVEMIWLPRACNTGLTEGSTVCSTHHNHNLYLSEALWLYCGQEMRVWLPLKEKSQSSVHTFISSRIMLGFPISIYPLTILFEKAIILGAENDCLSYTSAGPMSPDANGLIYTLFPFCILQRTSQVYLHQILRQLIRRNLGYYAWEIARSCSKLPYFPHSLELLLHEVLEEEATSKEPIPDALLPSVIEFVREFPVYLRTVGQCARKTELALWPHLFAVAGRPRALFDECLQRGQLDIAATYLLVIQNLESPTVSRKFATQLMDKALEGRKWDLVKDLVRFLKAIDPSDVEPMRSSVVRFNMQTPPVSPSEYDISMVLGTMQVPRVRSLSTSVVPKFNPQDGSSSHRELSRTSSETRPSPPLPPNQGGQSNSPSQISPSSNTNRTSTANTPSSGGGTAANNTSSASIALDSNGTPVSGSNNYQQNSSAGYYGSSPQGLNEMDKATPAGAMYVDAIIERHARKILSEGKLRDLGKLAAQLDFHLVSWLQKERRKKGVMVTDFVAALKMIHTEFEWPYPEFSSVGMHSRTSSTESMKFPSSETTSPLRPLHVDVFGNRNMFSRPGGGDSGYNSTPGGNNGEQVEARLMPHSVIIADDTISVLSEESILMDQSPIQSSEFTPIINIPDSSIAGAALNSSKAGVQLRFLQQIMWEAGALDWSLLISVALRDAVGVFRTVNASRDQHPDILRNLRDGLINVTVWSNTQCLGYKVFTTMINTQVHGLLVKYLSFAQAQTPAPNVYPNDMSSTPPHGHPGDLQRRKTEPSLGRGAINTKFGGCQNPAVLLPLPAASSRHNGPSSVANHHYHGHPGRLVSPKQSIASIPDSDETSEVSATDSLSGRRSSLSAKEQVDQERTRVRVEPSSIKTSKSENDIEDSEGQSNCSVV